MSSALYALDRGKYLFLLNFLFGLGQAIPEILPLNLRIRDVNFSMKNLSWWMMGMTLFLVLNGCSSEEEKPKDTQPIPKEESFFGQKPPGRTPRLFAPGKVSTGDLEIEAAVSPDLNEFYFIRQKKGEAPKSHCIQYQNGNWQESEVDRPSGEVFISTDNQIMYLGNKYKERSDSGWTEEKSLGEAFEAFPIMRLTVSAEQTYVFDEREELGILRYSRLIDGKREEPKPFSEEINTGTFTAHPFIAPDESYLIWDSERAGGQGGSDLYISFRQEDGSWGPAINLGEQINSEIDDTYGSITSDGKYFFFNRVEIGERYEESQADIFWVEAEVVMELKGK